MTTTDYILFTGTKQNDFSGCSEYTVVTGYSFEEITKTYTGRDDVNSTVRYLAQSDNVLTIDNVEHIPSEWEWLKEFTITYTALSVVLETKKFRKKSDAINFVKINNCISNAEVAKALHEAKLQSCTAEELI